MEKKYDVLCMGIAVADIMIRPVDSRIFEEDTTIVEQIETGVGGDAANESITCAKLGLKTGLFSLLGNDLYGRMIGAYLAENHVDTSHVTFRDDISTCVSIVMIGKDGARNFIAPQNTNSDHFQKGDIDLSVLRDTRALAYGGMYLMKRFDPAVHEVFKTAHDAGVLTIADCVADAYMLRESLAARVLPHLDYFVPSLYEAQAITGLSDIHDIVGRFHELGCPNVLIKQGAEGVYASCKDFCGTVPTFLDVPVLDTTGAGDNFVAGFLTALLEGKDTFSAVQYGNAVASICVGAVGATAGVRDRAQIDAFLRAHNL